TVTKIRNLSCEHGINVMNRSGDRLAKDFMAPRIEGAPRFALLQSAPNPFRGRTAIPFALAQSQAVHLTVFDLRGRSIARLVSGTVFGPGAHVIAWNGTNDAGARVSPGVYLYRIQTGGFVDEKKLIVLP